MRWLKLPLEEMLSFHFTISVPKFGKILTTVDDGSLLIFERTVIYKELRMTNRKEAVMSRKEKIMCCGMEYSL
jgi:hypothetical protein